MTDENLTIDLTPVINGPRVMEYAQESNTTAPYDHIAGRLAALSALADKLEGLRDEGKKGDDLSWAFLQAFEDMHKQVSSTFLGFFGSPA